MYIVVSHWKPFPGKESAFEANGKETREKLRGIDGLEMIEAFRSGDEYVVIHTYSDYDAYARLVEAEDGEISQLMASQGIEQNAEWIGSERGEAMQH